MPRTYVLLDWESSAWLLADRGFKQYLDKHFPHAWVGILRRMNHEIDDGLISGVEDSGRYSKRVFFYINYTGSLLKSVNECKTISPKLGMDDVVFLITNNKKDQEEAHILGWSGVALKKERGLFVQPNVKEMQSRMTKHQSSNESSGKPSLVISWDIDEMLIYYQESLFLGRIVFNPRALLFFKQFFQNYSQHFKIEIVVLTARTKSSNHGLSFISAENVIKEFCQLTKIPETFLRRSSDSGHLHYVPHNPASKYDLLKKLYPHNTSPVLHFDDNLDWWAQDENIEPHLFMITVERILPEEIKFPRESHDYNADNLFQEWDIQSQLLNCYGAGGEADRNDSEPRPLTPKPLPKCNTPVRFFTESTPLLKKSKRDQECPCMCIAM